MGGGETVVASVLLVTDVILLLCSWLSALESTKWLQHLSVMLKAAVLVANTVDREGRPVLVHCSDGWDRTPQIVALAKILLDPYYRTLEVLRGVGWERTEGKGWWERWSALWICLEDF